MGLDRNNPRLGTMRARESDHSYQWCIARGIELERAGYFQGGRGTEPAWAIPAWARFLCRTGPATYACVRAIVADPELQNALTALIASDLTDPEVWRELREITKEIP